jgi:hypothetical protein
MKELLEKYLFRHVRNTPLAPMQKVALFGVATLLGFTFIVGGLSDMSISRIDQMLSAVLPSVVVDLTNDERKDEHLKKLVRNSLLDEAARLKATHMRDNDYFEHFSPEGVSPWYWFDEVGYDYVHAGENLAVFFDDSEDVVKAWMKSPLHRDNILKAEYTEIGVATVEAEHEGYKTVFVVQLFGTPAQKPALAQTSQPVAVPKEAPKPVPPQDEKKVFGIESVVAETPREIEEIINPIPETSVEELPDTVLVEETQAIEPEKTNLVETVQIEDKTVYISDHANTSTVPVMSSTQGTTERATVGAKTLLNVLYVILLCVVVGLAVASIVSAEKRLHHVQAFYGVALLMVVFGLVSFHAQVVTATISLV